MGWRLVRQPNGKLARFSDVVDDFTHFDMSDLSAYAFCRDGAGVDAANSKLDAANANPTRFDECINIVADIHGDERAAARRAELSDATDSNPNPDAD